MFEVLVRYKPNKKYWMIVITYVVTYSYSLVLLDLKGKIIFIYNDTFQWLIGLTKKTLTNGYSS